MSHFSSCEFGHERPPESGSDTTQCPACQLRRFTARLALGYPPTGPLPPAPDVCQAIGDLPRRAA
jgi:hypothetical protein